MDDIIKQLWQEQQQKMIETAKRAIVACSSVAESDLEAITTDGQRRIKDLAYAWMLTSEDKNAAVSALAYAYYFGYKAGQEAEARRRATDSNGVDWGMR
jgi:hypothetical protein